MSKSRIPDESILFYVKRSSDGTVLFFNPPKSAKVRENGNCLWSLIREVGEGKRDFCMVLKNRPKGAPKG